jgi:predicted Rossmann fold flavoprotein
MSPTHTADVVIIGAGAAGLMSAIACARHAPRARVICLEGARTVGAKILVSGGARCNVTNREVSERDFWGGSPRVVRAVLRAFPAARAAEFFAGLGVALHEEVDGKLFPDSNRARTVLDALLAEIARLRIDLRTSHRVSDIRRVADGFQVDAANKTWTATHVALATGGRSLPKSGSDGFGYELARRLGHGHVETTPALAPLVLDDERLRSMSGVAHPATVSVQSNGYAATRLTGSLLWTHFGASGPVILDASRHWARAVLEKRRADVLVNVMPGESFESLDAWLLDEAAARPRAAVASVLASRLPAAVAAAWTEIGGIVPEARMAHLSRDERRSLVRALLETRLDVRDTRGYGVAEATAGGVPLEEIDSRTMASRVCPGLYVVGEILDVDGRIGGFNFQWAWSSGWVAGRAIAAEHALRGNVGDVPRGVR